MVSISQERLSLARASLFVSCLALCTTCGHDPGPTASAPRSVAHPVLDNLDPAVRDQISALRQDLDDALSNANTTAAELGACYGALGKHYHSYQFFNAAIDCYLHAAQLNPDDHVWCYLLAHAYRREGDYEKALNYFDAVIERKRGYIPAILWKGELYWELNALDKAETAFSSIVAHDPSHAHALMRLGQIAFRKKRYAEAVRDLEAAARAQPDADVIQYPLAMAYRHLGDQAMFLHHVRLRGKVKCKVNDPLLMELEHLKTGVIPLISSANERIKKHDYAGAAALYRQALELEPGHTFALTSLAHALSEMGEIKQAVSVLKQALATDATSGTRSKIFGNLGMLNVKQGQLSDARSYFQQALAANPANQNARQAFASLSFESGDYADSAELLMPLLAARPADVRLHVSLAKCLFRLARYRECLAHLEQAHELTDAHTIITAMLAQLLAVCPDPSINDPARALQLSEALVNEEASAIAPMTRAMALAAAGDFGAAISSQEIALQRAEDQGLHSLIAVNEHNLERYRNHAPADRTIF